jgi:predicted transcriptional regulator
VNISTGEGVALTLGSLEKKVFKACEMLGKASVRDILKQMDDVYAYTTIMTTCNRLHSKRVFSREIKGRSYIYFPSSSREELDRRTMHNVLGRIVDSMTEPVMEGFLDILEESDVKKIETLERLITKRSKKKTEG